MYRSIYVMYTHSYLIALTHSWAPRLRGIVLTTSHAPLYIEISTTDVGFIEIATISQRHRIADIGGTLYSRFFQIVTTIVIRPVESWFKPCVYTWFQIRMYQPGSSSWDMPVSCGVTTTWVPWYYIFHTHFFSCIHSMTLDYTVCLFVSKKKWRIHSQPAF